MNKYESVCILAQNCNDVQTSNMITKIENKIREFSDKPIQIENLGKKKLAYEIRKNKEGIYFIINFECNPEDICELERFYRITDEIIKFIVVRKDD